MNTQEYMLTLLAEECVEVAHVSCKALRFGMTDIKPGQEESNSRRVERELADLVAVAEMLGFRIREEDKAAKILKVKKYMEYSRRIGTLT